MIKRPMKAADLPTDKEGSPDYAIPFPVMATPKIDGIRAIIIDGVAYSARLKKLPNEHVQKMASMLPANNLDGELVVWKNGKPADFNTTQSGIMRKGGKPEFRFLIFDQIAETRFGNSLEEPYLARVHRLLEYRLPTWCLALRNTFIRNMTALIAYERKCVKAKYEGVVLRSPNFGYKEGRSTLREFGMIKWKRFKDSEAKIIGFEEKMHNANTATRGEIGQLKRSSAKAGMRPMGTLGALVVTDCNKESPFYKVTFRVSGFTAAMAKEIWQNKKKWLDTIITYRYLPHGSKDAPRHPTFKGRRKD